MIQKKFKLTHDVDPPKVGTDYMEYGFDRIEELMRQTDVKTKYLPRTILLEDMDLMLFEYIKNGGMKLVIDNQIVPTIYMDNDRYGEFKKTWTMSDSDKNVPTPYITVRRTAKEIGTRIGQKHRIPQPKTFRYLDVPILDNGQVIYLRLKMPEPTNVDLTYEVALFTKFRVDVNQYDEQVLRNFASRQDYLFIKGNPIPVLFEGFSEANPIENIDGDRFFVSKYTLKILGFIQDEKEFEIMKTVRKTRITTTLSGAKKGPAETKEKMVIFSKKTKLATVITASLTGITSTTAISGGIISGTNIDNITRRGVCYSTNPNPTTSNNTTSDGTGSGAFSSTMSGLIPQTMYYVRAYAINRAGTAYGNQLNFTTIAAPATLPIVTTATISAIGETTATSGGNVNSDGGATIISRGVCYATTPNPTINSSIIAGGSGTGAFTCNLVGLNTGTTYYIRAYATNSVGTSYGAQLSFATENIGAITTPTISTTNVTEITSSSLLSGGNISSDGGSSIIARGVCYGTSPNPTISGSKTIDGTGVGAFISSVDGLIMDTTYYIRAYATNSVGTSYGNEVSMTTSISPYLLAVDIPTYDSGDPTHFLITPSNSGFSQINNLAYTNFYVEPGNYGNFNITSSGTSETPRTLSLLGNGDIHPAQLAVGEQASVEFSFIGASYWVLDRISSIDYSDQADRVSYIMYVPSTNIIFNRMHLTNFCRGFGITSDTRVSGGTGNITIQNSRLDSMARIAIDGDNSGIMLLNVSATLATTIKDVHIINNEIINCNDGIHALRSTSPWAVCNYEGLIIDNNHIYITSDLYTDGNGNFTTSGNYALTENAIDIKAGSSNPANPIVITNNKMWGFRKTDSIIGGSGDYGTALVAHYESDNIVIKNNVIFDTTGGIAFRDAGGQTYSVKNTLIEKNIIANIGAAATSIYNLPIIVHSTFNITINKNVLINNTPKVKFIETYLNAIGATNYTNNANIFLLGINGDTNQITRSGNFYYDATRDAVGDGTFYATVAAANMENLTFITDKFTNSPRTITLIGAKSTVTSPHWLAIQ